MLQILLASIKQPWSSITRNGYPTTRCFQMTGQVSNLPVSTDMCLAKHIFLIIIFFGPVVIKHRECYLH